MNVAIKILITNCVLNVLGASSQECTGPLSFTNDVFTIRGPCPDDIVLVTVGSTIQYRCDYTDETLADDLPYWHVLELTGTPFLAGEGSEHEITIMNDKDGQSRDSTLSIPVKAQYLNTTLSIQCGLCSGGACYSEDKMSQSITSITVKMITHGPPRHLSSSNVSDGIVMFQWSRPLVSDDSVVFIYTVHLMGTTSSVILVFNTTNTYITLSRNNITDTCIEYTSWSVSVENSYNTILTDGGNISVVFQKEPSFTSDITTKLLNCSSINILELTFTVSSLQPLNTLDYDIWLNDTTNINYYTKHNTSSITFMDQLVQIQIPLIYTTPAQQLLSITVTISNECEDTREDVLVIGKNTIACDYTSSTLLSAVISSIDSSSTLHSAPFTSSYNHKYTSVTVVIPNTTSNKPTPDSVSSSSTGIIVGVSVCVVVVLALVVLTLVIVVVYTRYSKHSTIICVKSSSSPMNISPSTSANPIYGVKININKFLCQTQTKEPEQQRNICYSSVKFQVDDGCDHNP